MRAVEAASHDGFHFRDALSGAVTMLVVIMTILFFAWKRLFKQIRRREQHLAVTSARDLDTDTLRHALGQVQWQAAQYDAMHLYNCAGLLMAMSACADRSQCWHSHLSCIVTLTLRA